MADKQKFTANQIIEALRETKGMVYLAAKALRCNPQTVYNYAKRYKSVQQAIDDERGQFLDVTELALNRAVQNGEGWAIAFALKTIGKVRGYVDKKEVVAQSVNLEVDLSDLTDEQLKRLAGGENISFILSEK
jgi:uncharacterized Ntn-hydrolase superfamily protein